MEAKVFTEEACRTEDLLKHLYSVYRSTFYNEEIVTGSGNPKARILLIGEAPGKDEVIQSKPFVGAAGRQLTEFLELIGLEREEIYITNAIKYRLSKVNEKTGRTSNRPAKTDEIIINRPYLLKEIDIIRPEFIVTLGNVPLKALTGDFGRVIGNMHGEGSVVEILNQKYTLFPLYHPASIIYNRSLKGIYIDDILKLKSLL
ncbi:MAG: uracil-DNA glycosylase [Clostridiales bacterium]|nr:uracil-DNA glycosylase [Clostridiales bacterium]